MVSKKKETGGATLESARAAGQAAAALATPKAEALKEGRKPQAGTLISIRIDPVDKEMLKATFGQCGVKLAGGIKLSALYVLQEIKAGRLVMSKAGLFSGRQ
jgi:hypothetical protein